MDTKMIDEEPEGKPLAKPPQIGSYIVDMHVLPTIYEFEEEFDDLKILSRREISVSAENIEDAFYFFELVKNAKNEKKAKNVKS